MHIFVINVGHISYSQYSLPLIKALCDYNSVPLTVITHDLPQNIYKLHPSWLKLFCHDMCSDNFAIAWDCDLVPTKPYKFDGLFDTTKLNLAYDAVYVRTGHFFNEKFKYNCGLIGMPQEYASRLKALYHHKGKNSVYPSWEQYYVNDTIYDENWPVHRLDSKLNHMEYRSQPYDPNHPDNILNIHYTLEIQSDGHRFNLIKDHYDRFRSNFGL